MEEKMSNNEEIKITEDKIRQCSIDISKLQGSILDMGNQEIIKKNRFSNLTDIKETKLVTETLFEINSKTQLREKILEAKITKLQDQLVQHHLNLVKPKEMKGKKSQIKKSENMDERIPELDETFYPSCDEEYLSSSSSEDGDNHRNKKNHKRKNGSSSNSNEDVKKKRNKKNILSIVVQDEDRDNKDEKTSSCDEKESKKLLYKASSICLTELDEETLIGKSTNNIRLSLAQYTVKELKAFLSVRGLAVSGT
jgi:hypothetical protein